MATTVWDFEGITNGAAATAANLGITPNNPSPGAGGSILGTTDSPVGNAAVVFTNGTTAPCVITLPIIGNVLESWSIVLKMPAAAPPAVNNRLFAIFTGGTARGYVVLKPDGKLYAGGQGGSGEAVIATGAVMTPYYGTWVRIEFDWNGGSTATNGSIAARFYASPFTATMVGTAYSNAAINTGSGVITTPGLQVGVTTTEPVAGQGFTVDHVRVTDGSLTNPGPPASPSAPTVNAGADQYPLAGAVVTLSSTESGTVTSAVWSAVSWPDDSGSPSIAAPSSASTTAQLPSAGTPAQPVGGRYTFRRTLTYSGGTVADDVVYWVHPAASDDVKVQAEFAAQPAWSVDGGATSKTAAVNDANTGTGIASLDNPANQEEKMVMRPWGVGPISLYVEGYTRTATVTRTVTLYLEDGSTAVDQWTLTPGLEIANITEAKLDVDATSLATATGANDAATLVLRRALVVGVKSA